MAQFGGFRVPPLKNTLNVLWQTAKQQIPDKNKVGVDNVGMDGGGPSERTRFAGDHQPMTSGGSFDQTEMASFNNSHDGYSQQPQQPQSTNPFNPFLPQNNVAEDSFSAQGYQQTDGSFQGPTLRQASLGSASESSFGGEEGGKCDVKINEWQAAWNVTNAIQGMFIVSLPFAVLRGGYWAILAMVGIAYICCYTGKILVECLYEFDPIQGRLIRVRSSYVGIAKECFGAKYGARIVSIAQIIELLMTCILYVVVCGDLMVGTFPTGALDTRSWMMLTGVFLIPLAFLKSLKSVSILSFWCTMSHLFINAIIFGYCLLEISDWGWSKVKWTFDFENFPISLGVIVFSYTSQIFLPTLEGNMEDPSKFAWMLDWSHIAAAIFKALFGYVCFLTFQNDTQQVITNNLHGSGFKGLVNFCLVIKAILSYPLPYYAACELLERAFFRGKPKSPFPTIWTLDGELKVWGLAWKLGVIVFTIFMAVFIPHFSILMGFIGSFTGTMLSFIWPCYFHINLKGSTLDRQTIIYDCCIIALGVLFGVIGVYDSGTALIKAFEIGLPF